MLWKGEGRKWGKIRKYSSYPMLSLLCPEATILCCFYSLTSSQEGRRVDFKESWAPPHHWLPFHGGFTELTCQGKLGCLGEGRDRPEGNTDLHYRTSDQLSRFAWDWGGPRIGDFRCWNWDIPKLTRMVGHPNSGESPKTRYLLSTVEPLGMKGGS